MFPRHPWIPVVEEQSWTRGSQSGGVEDQLQCRGMWQSISPSARSLSRSPSPPPPSSRVTQSPTQPPHSLLVRDGQTSPHRPRLVVSRSTCPPLSPSPHASSFVIGTAVINTHIHTMEVPQSLSFGTSVPYLQITSPDLNVTVSVTLHHPLSPFLSVTGYGLLMCISGYALLKGSE
jgi:hypothetical protein